jgi:DNA-binding PadR family transcriptional regulator
MALEHALLVALAERPGSGLELRRRFDRSIGFFWQATHQQIYRVLGRMAEDGWVSAETETRPGGPEAKVYAVTEAGHHALAAWLAAPTPPEPLRSDLAVKMRGAAYGDRRAVLASVRAARAEHATLLAHYEHLERRDHPDPAALEGQALDQYLVLRGGILGERARVAWLTEYLRAHGADDPAASDPLPEPAGGIP